MKINVFKCKARIIVGKDGVEKVVEKLSELEPAPEFSHEIVEPQANEDLPKFIIRMAQWVAEENQKTERMVKVGKNPGEEFTLLVKQITE
jgi:hypothetical protein